MKNLCEILEEEGSVICRLPGTVMPCKGGRGKYKQYGFLSGLALFYQPEKVFCVNNTLHIQKTLNEIETLCREGFYAAGFISYEASKAFDNAYKTAQTSLQLPLLWFGIYRKYFDISKIPF